MFDKLKTCLGCLLLAGSVAANAAPASHAMTLYGEPPKYPEDFSHFDYVNPQAPKGGTLRLSGFGSLDSFNGFISRGTAASELGLIYDTLTVQSLDEPFSEDALLAARINRTADNTWL